MYKNYSQHAKGQPLVNLVDNMVKLGSLYNRNNTVDMTNGHYSSRYDMILDNAKEQRLFVKDARDWDLSPDREQFQAS